MQLSPSDQLSGADRTYTDQVTAQTERITAELNKLEQMLMAGMVDRRVLISFREAVNRIRNTSWSVQQSLEAHDGQSAVASMLLKERIRIAEQLATQLSADLASPVTQPTALELASLEKAIEALSLVLLKRKGN
jgi:hypothetical protein